MSPDRFVKGRFERSPYSNLTFNWDRAEVCACLMVSFRLSLFCAELQAAGKSVLDNNDPVAI